MKFGSKVNFPVTNNTNIDLLAKDKLVLKQFSSDDKNVVIIAKCLDDAGPDETVLTVITEVEEVEKTWNSKLKKVDFFKPTVIIGIIRNGNWIWRE